MFGNPQALAHADGDYANQIAAARQVQDAAEAARYNADIARQESQMIESSGALDASRQRKATARLIGTQKAAYAGAGVELTGSPLDVMINTAAEGELDAKIIEYNTKVRAVGAMSQADYDERLAGIYERSGAFKAGSTLLTSGAQLGAGYIGYGSKPPAKTTKETGY
jgi:hypothetical protein